MPAGDPVRNVEANREDSLYIFHLNFAKLSRRGPQASRPAAPAWHMGMKAYSGADGHAFSAYNQAKRLVAHFHGGTYNGFVS